MELKFDLHTHTVYSHGKGTISQNVAQAQRKNVIVSISEHGPGHCFFGVGNKKIESIKKEIKQINQNYGKIVCLYGIEFNLMSFKKTDMNLLKDPVQINLMGFHTGIFPRSIFSAKMMLMKKISPEKAKQLMTNALIHCIENEPIDIITHPGEYVPIDSTRLATACVKNGVVLEINNSHKPNIEQLKLQAKTGAFFVLSSDAHQSANVGEFGFAIDCAKKAKIPLNQIINTPEYKWQSNLRIDRIENFVK